MIVLLETRNILGELAARSCRTYSVAAKSAGMHNQMGTEDLRGREGRHTDAGDSGASIVVSPRLSCVWGVGGPHPPPLKSDGGCEARLWCMLNDCGNDSGNVGGSKCGNAKRDPDDDCPAPCGMILSYFRRGFRRPDVETRE